MKNTLITLLLLTVFFTQAQVGIGVSTTNMNASAQLEVASTTKGFLPPRMLASERALIASPTAGLLVFQTDAPVGLYYYTGSAWTIVSSGSNYVDLSSAQTVAGVKTFSSDLLVNGLTIGKGAGNSFQNTSIGKGALASNMDPSANNGWTFYESLSNSIANSAFGINALNKNTTGGYNTALGASAMYSNTNGKHNTAIGNYALNGNTSGLTNTAIGDSSMTTNLTGSENTAVGYQSLQQNKSSGNTGLGSLALYGNSTGTRNTAVGKDALGDLYRVAQATSDNTALGYQAGIINQGASNTFIGSGADQNTGDAAIVNSTAIGYGAKVNAQNTIQLGNASVTAVKTSGKLTTGTVTYPNMDGSANQVLSTNGNGVVSWANATTPSVPTWNTLIPSITATTTDPTFNTDRLSLNWRMIGPKEMECVLVINTTTAGNFGSGDYLLPVPGGYSIDTSLDFQTAYTSGVGANDSYGFWRYGIPGGVGRFSTSNGTGHWDVFPVVYNSNYIRLVIFAFGSYIRCWGSNAYGSNASMAITARYTLTVL
jgi:hypothetical protein